MIALLILAQVSVPQEIGTRMRDVRAIFTPDDMPDRLSRSGRSAIVYSRTTVRPDGTIKGCIAEISSGDRFIDQHTCSIIKRRARFLPATWDDGTPVYGIIRMPIVWLITDLPTEDLPGNLSVPDLEVFVDRLPTGARSSASVTLVVSADDTGKIVRCGDYPPPKSSPQDQYFPELVPLACQQAIAEIRTAPASDESGKPVRSVQNVSVEFLVKK